MEEASSAVQAQACIRHLQVRAVSVSGELVFHDVLDCSMGADIRQRFVDVLGVPSDRLSIWVMSGHCLWPLLDSDFLQPLQRDGIVQLMWRRRSPIETHDIRHCRDGDSQRLSKKTQANLPLEMFLLGLRRNPRAFKHLVPVEAYDFMKEYERVKRLNRGMVSGELFDFVQAWWLKGLVADNIKPVVCP